MLYSCELEGGEMPKKAVINMILTFLLANMFASAFKNQPAKASGTIYIRADGGIDPDTAPISTMDNVTYTLVGSITSDANGIEIEILT